VRRAREGDREAFAALVDLYWDRVHRFLYGLTRHGPLAEDLTQDAFFKAWTSLPNLEGDLHFRAWIYRIARNCLIDGRRGRRGEPLLPLPGGLQGREPDPAAAALEREAEQVYRAACERLPLSYREAYLLWTQEELPYEEIASVLGASEVAVRWRVFKARQFLRQLLKPFLDAPKP
jgi:RNA polymerase sigma-70 factor (ECF subfamily)